MTVQTKSLYDRLGGLDAIKAVTDRTVVSQLPRPEPAARPRLTRREIEVLAMVADGLLARTIAARMNLSPRTVHKHLGSAYRKLEAHDRLLAVLRAQAMGLIPVHASA